MPIIDWKAQYLIGMKQIDLHHQYLFSLLNTTYDNFIREASADSLSGLFDDLVDYAIYHFFTEEEVMRTSGYPGLDAHKEEHDRFSQRVVEMQKDLKNGKKFLTLEILSFLQNWLSHHILHVDAEIGRFLSMQNTQSPSKEARSVNV